MMNNLESVNLKLNIDYLDILILRELYFSENGGLNSWAIMEALYPGLNDDRIKRTKNNLIKYRLKRMSLDLVKELERADGKIEFLLVVDNLIFKKHKFPTGGIRDCIYLRIHSRWYCIEIDKVFSKKALLDCF